MDPQIEAWISELELGEFVDQLRAEGLIDTRSLAALSELDIETFAHASGMRLGAKARLRKLCDRCRTEGNTGVEQVQLELTEGDAELVNGLPTPLARAFREVLRKSPATTTNDDVRRAVDVLLRFLALVCYADYLHTPDWQDPSINERFLKLQDLGSLGSWREFIDSYVTRIRKRSHHDPFLRELPDVWRRSEHDKPVSIARELCDKYGRPMPHVSRLGRVEWLINRRNLLTHDHIHSGDAAAAEENRTHCIELFREYRFLCRYALWAGSSNHAFLLRGCTPPSADSAPPSVLGPERDVLLLRPSSLVPPKHQYLPLPPLMLDLSSLPGGQEQVKRPDGEVVILDVIRGNVATYRVPVPAFSRSSEREVTRIRQLGESKEFVFLKRDQLDRAELCRRIVAATDRTYRVLKSSGKFDPELHVCRSDHEPRLTAWIDSTLPMLGICADAGSGKTGILASLVREWRTRDDKAVLFLLASQYQEVADLDLILQRALALDGDVSLADASAALDGLVIAIDGINEHPHRASVAYRVRAYAARTLESLKGARFALTWRSEDSDWMADSLARKSLWWVPQQETLPGPHVAAVTDAGAPDDDDTVSGTKPEAADSTEHPLASDHAADHGMHLPGHTTPTAGASRSKAPDRSPTVDGERYVHISGLTEEECAEVWRRYRDRPELRMRPRFEWAELAEHNPGLADRLRNNPLEMRLTMRCLHGRTIRDVHDEMHVFADYLDGVRQEFRTHRVDDLLDTLGSLLYRNRTIRFTRDDLRNSCAELIEPKDGVSALIVLEDEGIVTSLDRRAYTFAVERLAEQIIGERLAREPSAESGAALASEASRLVASKFAQAQGVIQVALDQRIRTLGGDAGDQFLLDFIDACPPALAQLASVALEMRALDMGEEGAATLAAWLLETPSESDVEAVIKASQRLARRSRHLIACALLRPFLHESGHPGARDPIRHAQLACEFVACAAEALDCTSEDQETDALVADIEVALDGLRKSGIGDSSSEVLRLLGRALLSLCDVDSTSALPWDRATMGREAVEACRRRLALCDSGQDSAELDDARVQLAMCLHRVGTLTSRAGDDASAEQLLLDALKVGQQVRDEERWDPSRTHWQLALLCERQDWHDRRLSHLKRCLEEELLRRRRDDATVTWSEIGEALISLGQESEGLMQHQEAVRFADQHADRRRRAVAREQLGDALQQANRLDEALEAYEQSYRIGMTPHRIRDWYCAVPLSDAADVLGKLGRWDEAIERRTRAIDAWRQDENRRGVAIELEELGDLLRKAGRSDEAIRAYEDSFREGMTPERVDRWSPAPTLTKKARVLGSLNRWQDAIKCVTDAVELHREDGDRRALTISLERLGDTLRRAGRLEDALKAYQDSYATGTHPEPVDDWRPAIPLSDAADVLDQLDRWEEAIALRRKAIEAWRTRGYRRGIAIELELMGDALRELGRIDDALDAYAQAIDAGTIPELAEDWSPGSCLREQATTLGMLQRWEDAIRVRQRAIEAWRADGDRRGVAVELELLGDLLRDSGQLEQALQSYRDSYREGTEPERVERWHAGIPISKAARVLDLLERWDDALVFRRQAVEAWRRDGSRRGAARELEYLGDTLRSARRLDEALKAYDDSYEAGMVPEQAEGWSPSSCLRERATTLGMLERWDEAVAVRGQAIEAWRADGDRRGVAIELELLGDLLAASDQPERAVRAYEDSYHEGMQPQRVEHWSPGVPLSKLVQALGTLGRWADAVPHCRDAVAVRQQDGDRRSVAIALEQLGRALHRSGQLEEALEAYEQAYETGMTPEPVSDWHRAIPLSDAADVLGALGRWDECISRRRQAIDAWRIESNRRGIAIELELLGDALREGDLLEEALEAYEQACATGVRPEPIESWHPARVLSSQSDVLDLLGRWDECIASRQMAIEAWRKVDNRGGVAIELELLGDAFRESQRIDDALAAYAESYREGMTPHQAERWRPASCLRKRAELLLDLGSSEEAVEVLRTAISHAETDRATPPSFADDCMLLMLTCALGRALHAIGSSADALESMHAARPVAESCYSDSDADDACVEAAAKWWSTEATIWRALGGTHEADESELRARALAARVCETAP